MASQSMAQSGSGRVVVGVDTHKDVHVASAKDELGCALGQIRIPASANGYRTLLAWSRDLGGVRTFGVEGTGCYGAGLARYLRRRGEVVIEVIRPTGPQAPGQVRSHRCRCRGLGRAVWRGKRSPQVR